eukprot:gene8022-12487_t
MIAHNDSLFLFFGEEQHEYIFSKIIVEYNLKQDKLILLDAKNSPFSRRCHVTLKLKNLVYLFGGDYDTVDSNETSCFNLDTHEWTQLDFSNSDQIPCTRRYHCGSVDEKNNTIYIFGGNHYMNGKRHFNDLWALKNNKWKELKINSNKKPECRRYSAMVSKDEFLYLFGGRNDKKRFGDFWKFNKINNQWHQIKASGTPPRPKSAHSLVVNGNSIYLFGGNYGQVSNRLFQYDISMNTWRLLDTYGGLPTPRYWHAATLNEENEMIIHGGYLKSNLDDFHKINLNSKKNEISVREKILQVDDFFNVLFVFKKKRIF